MTKFERLDSDHFCDNKSRKPARAALGSWAGAKSVLLATQHRYRISLITSFSTLSNKILLFSVLHTKNILLQKKQIKMKSTISSLLSLAVLTLLSVSSTESFSLSPKPVTAFLNRNRNVNQNIVQQQVAPSQGEAASSSGKQSLDEFNALCQQIIAEERKQHYYAFVAECSNRTF